MTDEDAPPPTHRGVALFAILVATFANYLTITVLTIALAPVAREMHASIDDAAWVTIAPALFSGLLTPAFGKLADRHGRRKVFRWGLLLFVFGTLGSALATNLGELIAARVITGIGSAASMPSGIALATSLFAPRERAVPMGYWTSVTAFAPAIGVSLGGSVIDHFSWRWLFIGQIPFALGSLVAAFVAVPESEGSDDGSFDYAGATLLGGSFFLLTLAANRGNAWGLSSSRLWIATLVAVAALVALVRVEKRVANPVVPLRAMADPIVRLALLGRSLMYAVHMGSFLLLPLYLLDLGGRSATEISLILLPRPLAMGFAAPLAARLTRRFGASAVLVLGVAAMFVGITSLVFLAPDDDAVALLPSLLGMGFGLGLSQTVTASEIAGRTPREDLGASSAMLAIATALSGSLGSALLLAVATRTSAAPERAFRDAFVGCSVVCALALATAFAHVRERRAEARAERPMEGV